MLNQLLLSNWQGEDHAVLKRLNPLRLLRVVGIIWLAVRNRLRLRHKNLDYILLTLPGSLPPLPEQRSWLRQRVLGAPPISLWDIDRIFRRIAADPRPKGVILRISGLALPLADLQTLRGSMERLRAQGKRVIVLCAVLRCGAVHARQRRRRDHFAAERRTDDGRAAAGSCLPQGCAEHGRRRA